MVLNDGAAHSHPPRFEIIPIRSVDDQLRALPRGSTVTVTSSPRLGIERTTMYVERLSGLGLGLNVVPHLSARQVVGRSHLERIVTAFIDLGVRDLFVVGGDDAAVAGEFASAGDLLDALCEVGNPFQRIGVAGYPESHPLVDDDRLLAELLRKQKAAQYIVSQICFDPAAIIVWLRHLRRSGVDLPVYLGVPGVVRRTRLLELSFRLGVGDSLRHLSKQRALGDRLLRRSTFRPDALVDAIDHWIAPSALGTVGLHYFTFNEVAATGRWIARRANADEQSQGCAQ